VHDKPSFSPRFTEVAAQMRLASSSEALPHHSHAMKQTNPVITDVQSAANATSQSSNYNMLRMTFLSNSVL
jgi:hypothetical protein